MATKILRLPAVKERTGLSRSVVYRRIAEGEFPQPILLGTRSVGWVEAEVQAWVERQIRASRGPVRAVSRDSNRAAARKRPRKDARGKGARGKGRK